MYDETKGRRLGDFRIMHLELRSCIMNWNPCPRRTRTCLKRIPRWHGLFIVSVKDWLTIISRSLQAPSPYLACMIYPHSGTAMDPERSQVVSIALKPGSTGDSGVMDDAHLRWCHGRADPSSESRFCCAAKADMLLRDKLHMHLLPPES